jgi:uncharacterized lipoprotein YmbA
MIRFLSLTILSLIAVAGCTATPEPRQYLLEAPATLAPVTPSPTASSLGLREIALPLYARRQQIAAFDPAGTVMASDEHRWAEEPAPAATRLLARTIADETGGQVFVEPWGQSAAPDLVASVEVDRFIGTLGGNVVLVGQLEIAHSRGTARPEIFPFRITAPVSGGDWPALTAAYGTAVADLGRFIAVRMADVAG